jgi:hypothetical protein
MKALKAYLESRPDVTEVYVNESGEWLRHQTPAFNTLIKRADVLKANTQEPAKSEEKTTSKNPSKK